MGGGGGESEEGGEDEGIGLHVAKRGCDEITSSFVTTRTNLIPSLSLTYTNDGMVSVDSKSVSPSLTTNTLLTVSHMNSVLSIKYLNNKTTIIFLPH